MGCKGGYMQDTIRYLEDKVRELERENMMLRLRTDMLKRLARWNVADGDSPSMVLDVEGKYMLVKDVMITLGFKCD